MRATTAVVLVVGTALVAGGGYLAFKLLTKSQGLPGARPGSTGSDSKAGGGNASSDWASQLATLIGAGADAYDKVTN